MSFASSVTVLGDAPPPVHSPDISAQEPVRSVQNVGVSPGRDTRYAESGCFPGRDWSSSEDEMNYCVLDDYCINSA